MPEADEVELIDYLNTLWKWKFLIFTGTLAAVITAFAVGVRTPFTYEATATLLVTESKIPRPEGGEGGGKPGVSPETFEAMIMNQSLALQAVQQFGLDKEPFAMTPARFLNNIVSIKPKRGTNLLTLTTILPDPKLAADIANFVAQKAVELNARLNQTDTISTKEFVQHQRDQTRLMMDTAQAALTEFTRSTNIESLRTEQKILLGEKVRLATLSSNYSNQLKGLQTSVAELERAAEKHEQFLTVSKSIFSEPLALAAAQERGTTDLKALSSLQIKSQEINEVYQTLQRNLIDMRAHLVSLESQHQDVTVKLKNNEANLISINQRITNAEARLEELTRNYSLAKASYKLFARKFDEASLESQHQDVTVKLKNNEANLISINQRITNAEARLEELTRNYSLAKASYELLARKFDEASLSVASRVTELKIVDPAVAPTAPRGRKIIQSVAVAGAAALVACIILTFFLEYLRETKGRRGKIPLDPAPS